MTTTTTSPIVVNASPTPAQIESALRSLLTGAGVAATAMGWKHMAGDASLLLQFVGPLATIVGVGLSQWAAFHGAKTKAYLADQAPNSVAVTK